MRHTKSMVYNETTESRELFCYAINNGDLYRKTTSPIIEKRRRESTTKRKPWMPTTM